MALRYSVLALLAMTAGIGCNAGNSGGQVRKAPAMTPEALSKTRIIAQINKNAEAIKSLEAEPSIVASFGRRNGNLKGRMRMEREKDFRLKIALMSKQVADIGSNEKGFWFWVLDDDKKDNNIYTCEYDKVGSSRLAATMQPDWIMESMGLRTINSREAATINAKPGDLPGQLLLTQLRTEPNGATYTKETLVNENTGAIIEHRLYSGAKKELLARATIKRDNTIELPAASGETDKVKVILPQEFELEWYVEKFKLEITMGKTTVNPSFSPADVAVVFSEPTIPGANRIDLAAVNQTQASSSSFIHESMPRSGIRLGQPQGVPSSDDGVLKSNLAPSARDAGTLPQLPTETEVIGPPLPQGASNDPATVRTSARSSWQRPTAE